jgi:hypothetical protein
MASKWMKGTLVLPVIVVVVCGSAIFGQTSDGQTPAQEDVCDDLQWATPGLYGLCIAFCEAQDCEPDFSALNPFAECRPSSAKLLRNYEKKKQPGDPEMPCVRQAACPCWTEAELDALRFPASGDVKVCTIDAVDSDFGYVNLDQWQVRDSGTAAFSVVATFQTPNGGSFCALTNACSSGDSDCVPAAIAPMPVTAEEFAVCEAQLNQAGADRALDCFTD